MTQMAVINSEVGPRPDGRSLTDTNATRPTTGAAGVAALVTAAAPT
jgi:hypothetical protein